MKSHTPDHVYGSQGGPLEETPSGRPDPQPARSGVSGRRAVAFSPDFSHPWRVDLISGQSPKFSGARVMNRVGDGAGWARFG